MTEYVSAGSRLAFGRETTFGTQVAVSRFLGITNQAVKLPDKRIDAKKYRSFGVGRRFHSIKPGRRERAGSFSLIPTTGELFYYVFGQDSFTAGSPNTHVMSPARVARLPSMSLGAALEGAPDFLRTFLGYTVGNIDLTLSEQGELQANMGYMAKSIADFDTDAPTLFAQPTTDSSGNATPVPYMFYDRNANMQIGGAYNYTTNAYTGGRSIARVKGFNCGINNNLKPQWFSQNQNAQDPFCFLTSYPDFTLSVDVVPAGKKSTDTDSIYDLFESEIRTDVLVPFYRSSTDRLDLVFDNCLITEAPHDFGEDGGEVTVNVKLEPEEFRVVVRDGIANYSSL